MSDRSATIIVPCYNEAARLQGERFVAYAREHRDVQILFVDDGSTDATWSVLERLCGEFPESLRALKLDCNGGKAEAVRRGLLRAMETPGGATNNNYVGFWDADLATPLEEIGAFCDVLDTRREIDMVFGSRVNLLGRNVRRRLARHYIGRIFATAASGVLRLPIYDTQCGAKLFRANDELKKVCADPFLSRWIFDVEMIARYIQLRHGNGRPMRESIYERPLTTWTDVKGSKLKAMDFFTVGFDLVRIKMRYFM